LRKGDVLGVVGGRVVGGRVVGGRRDFRTAVGACQGGAVILGVKRVPEKTPERRWHRGEGYSAAEAHTAAAERER